MKNSYFISYKNCLLHQWNHSTFTQSSVKIVIEDYYNLMNLGL